MTQFDLNAIMQQAQQMQQNMQSAQDKLALIEVEGSSGAGMVKVVATGAQRVKSIVIDETVRGEDTDMLQDLIVAAVNQALEKSREIAQKEMGSLVPPGVLPPGFPQL